MTTPPPGGQPPPEQNPAAGQGAPPPAGPPPGYQGPPGGYPPQGPPPAGPPPGQGYPAQPPAGPPSGQGYPGQPPAGPPAGQGYPGQPPAQGYPGQQPPGGYPQGPPGYQGAPQQGPSGSIQFDASKATNTDWIVMGSALVIFIFSFFGWMSASLGMFGSYSVGAWHRYWWIGPLLGLAVGVVVALRALLAQPLPQIKPMFLAIGAGVGFLVTLIALIEMFARSGVGPGVGIWICFLVSAAQTYFVWLWGQKQPDWTLPKLPGPANF